MRVTLSSHRVASSLVRLVVRDKRWDASEQPQRVCFRDRDGNEPNCTAIFMLREASINDGSIILYLAMMNFVDNTLALLIRENGMANKFWVSVREEMEYTTELDLNGYVNKQNCRIWSEANSQEYVETLLHPEKRTVWCALWAGGIIGPYFFKNDEGHNVIVNGDRYRAMITNFFIPELNNHDVQELWF
ncbi:uncharacterized protein TNCV_3678771 [Trichonephila clavipes]|nr:uncharacterized protein TNCV_3678771 [Trichonephila clavipes]